jgi:hypothetical protein
MTAMKILAGALLALMLAPGMGASAATTNPPAARTKPVLPFLHDDYERAAADARARKVPLFVESWAPW